MAQFLDADVDYGEEPQDAGGAGVGRGDGDVGGLDGRGGDMPAAVIEGFSQVAGPAHAAAAQGDHGGQQGVDHVAGGRGGGLGVGGLLGGHGVGRGRGRGGAGGRQGGGGAVGRGRGVKARHWSFTINNYSDVPKELPRGPPPVKYLCFGRERSQNGTPHLQGFISFKNAVYRPSRFFHQYGNGHFEMAMGTVQENVDYCAKDGDFTEFGTRPQSRADQGHHGQKGGKRGGEVGQERWEHAWQMAKEGRVEDIPGDIRFRYYGTVLKVASRYQKSPAELEKLDNIWIWGPSGSGKSTYVHKRYPGHYRKGFNKWWDGFRMEDEAHQTVILDDLHPKWSLKEELKNWADKFPFPAEYKGGVMIIRPARIVITSNYRPEQVSISRFSILKRVSAAT